MTTPTRPFVTTASAQTTREHGGDRCPRCGAPVVAELRIAVVDGTRYQEMSCPSCGMQWTNVWELARLLVFGQGEDPEIVAVSAESRETVSALPDASGLLKVCTDQDFWTQAAQGSWQQQQTMICDDVRCELKRNEETMRAHIRAELRDDPALTHDGDTEADPVALEDAVSATLYDISGMAIDAEPGVEFDYGHLFALSEIQHFLTLLTNDPVEAQRILAIKQGVTPVT